MLGIMAARQKESESVPSSSPSSTSNPTTPAHQASTTRISASTLATFFDERRRCRTAADVERLALEFDLDPELVRQLATRFNTPTAGSEIVEQAVGPGEERGRPRVWALWEEPQFVTQKQIAG